MKRDFIFTRNWSLLVVIILCLILVSSTLLMTVSAKAEVATRGEAETEALTQAQEEYDAAQQKLQEIGDELEQTQYDLKETENKLEQIGVHISDTEGEIEKKNEQLTSAQNALAAYLEISYKSGTTSMLDLFLSSSDFNDLVTRSYYATKIQNAQIETINEIRQLKSDLEEERNTLADQQEQENELMSEYESQQEKLTQAQEEAQQVVDSLSDEVKALFEAQQAELTAAAEAKSKAASAAEAGQALGVNAPSESQGSIVADAYACLGIPYVWGGDDDNFGEVGGFDCSGFVQHCYALEGYEIGRTTWDQIDQIKAAGNWKESLDELEPGDLVFPSEGHVGIYIGNGQMIDAPYPGMYIQIDDVTSFIGGGSPV
jgi:cell wall-associated NlpC family hydrolase